MSCKRERWEEHTLERWNADCALFGLKPEHYGAEVTCGRRRVQMLGIRQSARRYPIVTRELRTNKRYDYPDMAIRKALNVVSAREAEEEDRACWNGWCVEHGLSPEDFGRTIVYRGASYKVCGVRPTAIKYHVVGKTAHGSFCRFPADFVRSYFRAAEGDAQEAAAAKAEEGAASTNTDDDSDEDDDTPEEGEAKGGDEREANGLPPMTIEQKRKLCDDLLRDLDDDDDWRTLQSIHSLTKKRKNAC